MKGIKIKNCYHLEFMFSHDRYFIDETIEQHIYYCHHVALRIYDHSISTLFLLMNHQFHKIQIEKEHKKMHKIVLIKNCNDFTFFALWIQKLE